MSDIRVENGLKTASPGGTISWAKGELTVPEGTVVAALEARIAYTITAIAADAGGMSLATQAAALETVEVTLKTDLSTSHPQTPIDQENLRDLEIDNNQLLEQTVTGGPGETTSFGSEKGLQGALAVGANRLLVVVPISLGHVEFINGSRKLFGAGHSFLEDCSLSFKVGRDTLAALEANVSITGYEVDLRVIPARTNSDGEPHGLVPAIVEVTGGKNNSIEGPDGLALAVDDTNSALAETTIGEIVVSVGPQVVTNDPSKPVDVQYRFSHMPDTGALESAASLVWTPLCRVGDGDLKDMLPGRVRVTMDNHGEDLIGRFKFLPLMTSTHVMEQIVARAGREESGNYIHAVNAAEVEGIAVGDEHLPFTGMRFFKTENVRFHTMAGVRCKKNRKPFLWVPVKELIACATEFRMALADRSGDDNTSKASARAVLIKYGRGLAGIFDSSLGAPPLGRETAVFSTFRRMVTDMIEDMKAAQAGQREPTEQRRDELRAAGKSIDELYAVPLE